MTQNTATPDSKRFIFLTVHGACIGLLVVAAAAQEVEIVEERVIETLAVTGDWPAGVAPDGEGGAYVADGVNHKVLRGRSGW